MKTLLDDFEVQTIALCVVFEDSKVVGGEIVEGETRLPRIAKLESWSLDVEEVEEEMCTEFVGKERFVELIVSNVELSVGLFVVFETNVIGAGVCRELEGQEIVIGSRFERCEEIALGENVKEREVVGTVDGLWEVFEELGTWENGSRIRVQSSMEIREEFGEEIWG